MKTKSSKQHTVSRAILFLLLSGMISLANATTITFDVSNIGGNTWEANYTVTNDTLGFDLEEFSVVFELGLYENIVASATPVDWDPLVFQPDSALPDDGLYDVLALSGGIASGGTLGGFQVQFDFLGAGAPGSQAFTVVDPFTFDNLEGGLTVATTVIPLPAAAWLFVGGLSILVGFGKKSRKCHQ